MSFPMGSYHDGFSTSLELYSRMDSPVVINQHLCGNGAYEMSIIDEVEFELPPYSSAETSWYSSSSEDLNTVKGFCQQSVNSSLENMIPGPRRSAFTTYMKADSNAAVNSFNSGQIQYKKCFSLLRKIEEERKLESQRSRVTVPAATADKINNSQQPKSGFQNKSAFEHMLAERNRRVKLKQHFSNLLSLLPRNSKRDKHSILANTTTYLTQLKLRVAELEERNQNLEESIPTNMSNQDQGSSGFESHEHNGTVLYHSDKITVEQCEDIPCQVNIRLSVQENLVSNTTDLLIRVLERLRAEHFEVLSIRSHTQTPTFHATILVTPKGLAWVKSKWQAFGSVLAQFLP
ncbi:hypothetical protein KI387_014743 [Taxus chinensis]|uniref:BHLH domain-containing protein n=1 Tax=Taxus chinensis TaxID=29808 RepID=A0AA38FI23_TAXCH|nr:hypothetical protein KI387_014743 [Taxus chinensis]